MKAPGGNLVALVATRSILMTSGLAVTILVARMLGAEGFGVYRWIGSVSAVIAFGANLGLHFYVTREVARAPEEAPRLMTASMATTGLLSLLTTAVMTAYVAVADGRPEVVWAGTLGAVTLCLNAAAQMVQGSFHGLRRMQLEVGGVLVGRVALVLSHAVLLWAGFGVGALYGAKALSGLLMLGVLLLTFTRQVGPIPWTVPASDVRHMLGKGRIFGATVFFGAIYAQADILLLQWFCDDAEVGVYGAPAGVLLQLAFIATIISRGVFPRMAAHVGDPVAAGHELRFQSRMLLAFSLPVAVGGAVVATPLVQLLFGAGFEGSVVPLLWLLATVPVRFLNNGLGMSLTALDMQRERSRIDGLGAGVNVLVNLVAIPYAGAVGAAATTLLTDSVILLSLMLSAGKASRGFSLVGVTVRTLAASLVMAGAVLAVPGLPVAARVAIGAVVYLPAALLTGAIRWDDPRRLRRI